MSERCNDSGTQLLFRVPAGETITCGCCGATAGAVEVPLRPADPTDHNTLLVIAEHDVPAEPVTRTITITRDRLAPVPGFSRPARWIYSYTIAGNPAVEYGTCIDELRRVLRRRYAGATIAQAW